MATRSHLAGARDVTQLAECSSAGQVFAYHAEADGLRPSVSPAGLVGHSWQGQYSGGRSRRPRSYRTSLRPTWAPRDAVSSQHTNEQKSVKERTGDCRVSKALTTGPECAPVWRVLTEEVEKVAGWVSSRLAKPWASERPSKNTVDGT